MYLLVIKQHIIFLIHLDNVVSTSVNNYQRVSEGIQLQLYLLLILKTPSVNVTSEYSLFTDNFFTMCIS